MQYLTRVEQDLQQERISHLDLSMFITVSSGTSIALTLSQMRNERVGAALVQDDNGRLSGIFTERDVLKKVAGDPAMLQQSVDVAMTTNPETVSPDDTVDHALKLMNGGDYRNVPVLDSDGNIAGNLSQQALIRFLTDRFPREIYNLPPDPELIAQTREGA